MNCSYGEDDPKTDMNIFNATRFQNFDKNKCLSISHQRTTMPTPTRRTSVSFVSDP